MDVGETCFDELIRVHSCPFVVLLFLQKHERYAKKMMLTLMDFIFDWYGFDVGVLAKKIYVGV